MSFGSENLGIINLGNTFTFMNAIRQEVLDLIIATQFIVLTIHNWQVLDETSTWNQLMIKFDGTLKYNVESFQYNIATIENLETTLGHFTYALLSAHEDKYPFNRIRFLCGTGN